MHVVYDHQIFYAQQYGGISRYFYELIARAATSAQLDVSLFQGFHVNQYGLERIRSNYRGYFGRPRPNVPRAPKLFAPVNRGLFELFVRRYPPDVYHPTYYGAFAERARGKRVLTVYDMIHERFPALLPEHALMAQKREAVRRADHILAISHSTKRDLVELLDVPEAKVTVTHLANSLRAEVTEVSLIDAPYVLYVAGRQPYKGFDTLVRAFGRSSVCRDLTLVCCGGKPFNATEQVMFREHGLEKRVVHLSGDDRMLARLYKHATVFVYPSQYEGFGLPPLEAMFYGCPVIVARSSSIPEVVGDAGVYFAPGEIDDLQQALERVLASAALREQLALAGVARERQFSWDRTFSETVTAYSA